MNLVVEFVIAVAVGLLIGRLAWIIVTDRRHRREARDRDVMHLQKAALLQAQREYRVQMWPPGRPTQPIRKRSAPVIRDDDDDTRRRRADDHTALVNAVSTFGTVVAVDSTSHPTHTTDSSSTFPGFEGGHSG